MTNHSQQIVQKLWNYCNVLRDDGLSYGDYVEQLTFLLFLKMADERTQAAVEQAVAIPKGYDWAEPPQPADGDAAGGALPPYPRRSSARRPGMLGIIFRKAQNKIQDPAKLRRLIVELIDKEQWSSLDADVKGDAYEGLLEKNAQDTKGGAGQYFTPAPLIQAIVDVHPAPARRDDLRPGLRHRRLPPRRPRLHRAAQPKPRQGPEEATSSSRPCMGSRSWTASPASAP